MTTTFKRNHINILGNGTQQMIFAHGFGSDQEMWEAVIPAFKEDYQLILFDHIGSGKSDPGAYDENKYNSLKGYVEDLLEVCEAANVRDAVFVGHSVSAMIGLLAANIEPGYFSKLILIGASPRYLNDLPDYYGGFEEKDVEDLLEMMEMNFPGWASYLAPVAMKNEDKPELANTLEQNFSSGNPKITRQFLETILKSDHRADLKNSTLETLLIQCSEDSFVPIEVGEYLHSNLSNSTLHVMDAKGHYPHLSHPGETADVIKNYLEKSRGVDF